MREYTAKEIKALQAIPYTLKVTKHKLFFTAAFKEAFWTGYQAGNTPRKMLADLGYDLSLFHQKQIDSITQRIRKEALSGFGFTEGQRRDRRIGFEIPPSPEQRDTTDEEDNRMWNELKYLRQEVEFLKKIVKAVSS